MIENKTTTLVIRAQLDEQDSRRYPRETTRPPNTTKKHPHLLSQPLTTELVAEGIMLTCSGECPSADDHSDQSTENSSRAVFGIRRRKCHPADGYEWCQTESTCIDYTIMRMHILYSLIGYQSNAQRPGFRCAPRLRTRLDPRIPGIACGWGCRQKALRSLHVCQNVERTFRVEAKQESTPPLLDSRDLTIVKV